MSGTSLDGVDAVLARLRGGPDDFEWELGRHCSEPFEAGLRRGLLAVAEGQTASAGEFAQLHFELGEHYAQAVSELLRRESLDAGTLEGIGISGQTVYHRSARALKAKGLTFQLGSAAVVAERTGATVISDFRSADVAAGGEGAPLVPYADYLLFRKPEEGRVILNIGGIANLTAIPHGADPDGVIAFDTGPGNMVTDGIVGELTDGRELYDRGGERAGRGRVSEELLGIGMGEAFFSEPPPRSTGREQFGKAFVRRWIDEGYRRGLAADDLVATACALTAESVAQALRRFVTDKIKPDVLHAAGGGVHNPVLMRELETRLEDMRVESTAAIGVPPECREALAFAVLAHETKAGRPGNLTQVTGAKRRVILGQISTPGM
jgi:anhydro-N-acetylmuramic acid kinase